MNRKILLVEPNYKNKYPPMGIMKIATYYRKIGDEVRFYKGDLRNLAADLICEDLVKNLNLVFPYENWNKYYNELFGFIKIGRYSFLDDEDIFDNEEIRFVIKEYRKKYKNKEFFTEPRFDRVGITTLFTFHWDITIDTINFVKQLCKNQGDVMVGGVMASILPDDIEKATGIKPFVGLLNHPGDLDRDNDIIIDSLPLDYSILEEIDYQYPEEDAYFAYMTRGCINRCSFCVVPRIEPKYCEYINIREQIDYTKKQFGEKGNLLLLDNNVLASSQFDKIVDEIKDCGFEKNSSYIPPNQYDIMINNLNSGYNDTAYIRKAIKLYRETMDKLNENEGIELYLKLEENNCLDYHTATKTAILKMDDFVKPLFDKTHNYKTRQRHVDFNQGVDSRLITEDNMKKISEISINPLRIAFDHWELKNKYRDAVVNAVNCGITHLSNYLLYNYEDKPEDLYNRLRMNIDLCEELDANIYSFPMKYHPIEDPEYFSNRNYIGKHWNRKFIRTIQAILNSTKGKVGRGRDFFNKAFGKNVDEFYKLLYMPETMIIYRAFCENNGITNRWWEDYQDLSDDELAIINPIIEANKFENIKSTIRSSRILNVLNYYELTRSDVEELIRLAKK